jgi:hypothetical protein
VRIEQPQRKPKKLRKKGLALQTTFEKKQTAASRKLDDYVKVECLELCDRLYKAFPREVRDMTYGYLHLGHEICVSSSSGRGDVAYSAPNPRRTSTVHGIRSIIGRRRAG